MGQTDSTFFIRYCCGFVEGTFTRRIIRKSDENIKNKERMVYPDTISDVNNIRDADDVGRAYALHAPLAQIFKEARARLTSEKMNEMKLFLAISYGEKWNPKVEILHTEE